MSTPALLVSDSNPHFHPEYTRQFPGILLLFAKTELEARQHLYSKHHQNIKAIVLSVNIQEDVPWTEILLKECDGLYHGNRNTFIGVSSAPKAREWLLAKGCRAVCERAGLAITLKRLSLI